MRKWKASGYRGRPCQFGNHAAGRLAVHTDVYPLVSRTLHVETQFQIVICDHGLTIVNGQPTHDAPDLRKLERPAHPFTNVANLTRAIADFGAVYFRTSPRRGSAGTIGIGKHV